MPSFKFDKGSLKLNNTNNMQFKMSQTTLFDTHVEGDTEGAVTATDREGGIMTHGRESLTNIALVGCSFTKTGGGRDSLHLTSSMPVLSPHLQDSTATNNAAQLCQTARSDFLNKRSSINVRRRSSNPYNSAEAEGLEGGSILSS